MALAHTYAANPHWLPRQTPRALDAIPGEDGLPIIGNTLKVLRDPKLFGDAMVAKHGRIYRKQFVRRTLGDAARARTPTSWC